MGHTKNPYICDTLRADGDFNGSSSVLALKAVASSGLAIAMALECHSWMSASIISHAVVEEFIKVLYL
ncbi:hypothetical protein [Nostoc sp.]|uniref:hypothetical protein n=1 Tax=Nostoc sp. TaxID=1180 RepID=UPI002FF4975B